MVLATGISYQLTISIWNIPILMTENVQIDLLECIEYQPLGGAPHPAAKCFVTDKLIKSKTEINEMSKYLALNW